MRQTEGSSDPAATLAGVPHWPEDDTLLRDLQRGPRWQNCCRDLCHSLLSWRGLRASDLDALERRQKAAEWSNVFSDGEWGSESGGLGTASQASDALGDVELADMDMWAGEVDVGLQPARVFEDDGSAAAAQMEQADGGAARQKPAMSPGQHTPQQPPKEGSGLSAPEEGEGRADGQVGVRRNSFDAQAAELV